MADWHQAGQIRSRAVSQHWPVGVVELAGLDEYGISRHVAANGRGVDSGERRREDDRGVEVGEIEPERHLAGLAVGELQQESEGVPVGPHGRTRS